MSAYKGKEKYIFVSYAAEDREQVLPIIENMQIAGFRIRYSENKKDETYFSIDESLEKSDMVLAFLSPNAVDDVNARKEIRYTLQSQREVLIAYLEEINLQYGLGKQLNGFSALYRSHYKTEVGFLNEILKAPSIRKYRALAADSLPETENEKNSTEQKKSLDTCKIGDTVKFGAYRQNGANPEAVEWKVLDIKDGKALLISKYGLDSKRYHVARKDVTWENATLRKWLNEEFLNTAFSDSEKAMIPTVTVSADRNPTYDTNQGNATQDKIFLLSVSEAKKYFANDDERKCQFTAFAKKNGMKSGLTNGCDWLLRTSGYKPNTAANVSTSGYVTEIGNFVSVSSYAVRPSLWVDMKAFETNSAGESMNAPVRDAQFLIEKRKLQKQCKVGNIVKFGTYMQNGSNPESIEWQVLDVIGEKALVISKYGLDKKSYNTIRADVTWETCTLRKWLNEEFLNTAFSESQKQIIPTVTVSADKNPSYNTNPGNATQDKIFLLSIPEVTKYFGDSDARKCKLTALAKRNGALSSSEGSCWWWLRSPADNRKSAAYVHSDGDIRKGGIVGNLVDNAYHAVRPAMWIDLSG